MKNKLSFCFLLLFLTTAFVIKSEAQVMMVSRRGGTLHTSFAQSMDMAFGVGKWKQLEFETVNTDSLLNSGINYIYVEGEQYHFGYMHDYWTQNKTKFEDWVKKGNILFVNSNPMYGNTLLLGFGEVSLDPNFVSDTIISSDITHKIFNDPKKPVGEEFWGYSTNNGANMIIKGSGLKPLLVNKENHSHIVLAEKPWGAGTVIFGTLNSMRYVFPQAGYTNLRTNILSLKNKPSEISAALDRPEPKISVRQGNQDVWVSLTNYGTQTLTEATINWEINGTLQTSFKWTKGLDAASGNSFNKDQFSVGKILFEKAKNYVFKAWVSDLNGTYTPAVQDTITQTIYTALEGSYSVGTENADFDNLNAALNALIDAGVSGPTVFNLADGTHYINQKFPAITGASPLNTITFQSISGDRNSTIIERDVNTRAEYLLAFKRASYLTFKNLTIANSYSIYDYGTVVLFEEGSHDISFINNKILGKNYNSGSGSSSTIYFGRTDSIPCYNILLKDNDIFLGSYGIYVDQSYNGSKTIKNLTIENNTFLRQFSGAMYLVNMSDLKVHGNKIEATRLENYRGIYVDKAENISIDKNNIYVNIVGYGIYVRNITSSEGRRSLISNNAFHGDGGAYVYGMVAEGCQNLAIVYNTLNITNTNEQSSGLNISGTGNKIELYNNNVCARGGAIAAAFNVNETFTDIVSDYNNYYSAGKTTFWINGKQLKKLSDWQLLSKIDSNSVSVDAVFIEENGYKCTKGSLDGAGIPIAEVLQDLEGKPRDASHPDIGADEFTSSGADLHLQALIVPVAPFLSGNYDVKFKVVNSGNEKITSFDYQLTFNGEIKPVQKWNGNLEKGKSVEINLGPQSFPFLKGNSLSVEVSLPNNKDDLNPGDNILSQDNLYAALPSGSYTIGGTTPDFTSFKEVESQLRNGGIKGGVSFLVRDGIYNEHIALSDISGSGPEGRIVFQSESGDSSKVTLSYYVNQYDYDSNYVVRLENISHIYFKNMTFKINGDYYAKAIDLQGDISDIHFSNNVFTGKETTSEGENYSLVYISGKTNPSGNLLFENNLMENNAYGFLVYSQPSDISGTMILKGNTLKNQYSRGFRMYNGSNTEIISNKITTLSTNSYFRAIDLSNAKEGIKILKNSININSGYGIYLDNINATASKRTLIANNYVRTGNASTSRPFIISYSKEADIYHNTFIGAGSNTSQYSGYLYNSSSIDIYNNHFINYGTSNAFYLSNSNDYLNIKADYNNYFTKGTSIIYSYNSSRSQYTLHQWKAYSGHDNNSSSIDPMIEEDSYMVTNPKLNGTAKSTSLVTDDINNITRSQFPDIGAAEFDPEGLNLVLHKLLLSDQVFSAGINPVSVIVRNNGTTAINSFTLNWKINETAQTDYLWTGNLAANTSDTIVIGNFDFKKGQLYKFEIAALDPNGLTDIDLTDNRLIVPGLGAPLSGVYTIGGTNPDFPTFTAAAAVLNNIGIAGKVTFNVRPGSYQEQIRLREIKGSNSERRVIFQSENSDSSTVTLSYYSGNSSSNYVLRLDSTDHVTFKNITIKSENSSYSVVVSLINGTTGNEFLNNRIISATQGYYNVIEMYSNTAGLNNKYNLFINNDIQYGNYGISLSGNSSSGRNDEYNQIVNNTFSGQKYTAIFLSNQYYSSIKNNTINIDKEQGIYLFSTIGQIITGNKINVSDGSVGIYVSTASNPDTVETVIANNYINIRGSKNAKAIDIYGAKNFKVYFNTFILNNNHASSTCISIDNTTNCVIKNNIAVSRNLGFALTINNSKTITSDYNNYYSQGQYLFNLDNNGIMKESWNATGQDQHSLYIDPVFTAAKDWQTNDPRINNRGIALPGFTTDIDGDLRGEHPDLGADENMISGSDLGLLSVTSPLAPVPAGNQTVKVILFNNGSETVETANLSWSVNDTLKTAKVWTGSLAPSESVEVSVGDFNLVSGATISVKVWISNSSDNNPYNDTLKVNNLRAGMRGIYTIGKENSDFINFTSAVAALTSAGVAGNVEFHVQPDTYTEQFIIPEIYGTSDTSTVTFKPKSEGVVKLTFASKSSDNYIIQLKGADYIRIIDLDFVPTSTYGICIDLLNGADNNIIKDNYFDGVNNLTTTNAAVINFYVNSSEFSNNNNLIENNYIKDGAFGVYISSVSRNDRNNIIRNNYFEEQGSGAIYVGYIYNIQITGNKVISGKSNIYYDAISVRTISDAFLINKNKIEVVYGSSGILAEYVTAKNGIIANNFITVRGTNNIYGIELSNSEYTQVYFNSVLNTSTSLNASAYKSYTCKYLSVVNNIFANSGPGFASSFDDISSALTSDYNNYYTKGSSVFASHAKLIDWQVARGVDFNSFALDPQFQSDTILRSSEVALNTLGKVIPAVKEDIDGEIRSLTKPSIGADENVPDANDAGIYKIASPVQPFLPGTRPIAIQLRNFGDIPLESATIHWTINGIQQPDFAWTGNLALGDTTLVTLGNFNFVFKTAYTIKVWTEAPNGMEDNNRINDTVISGPIYPALKGLYTIGGTNPDFIKISDAVDALIKGGVADSVQFNIRKGTYNEQVVIPSIFGASKRNSVVFQSESGAKTDVEISNTGSSEKNYLIQLVSADGITFRNISFRNSSALYSRALSIEDGSDNITVSNVVFNGVTSTNSTVNQAIIYSKAGDLCNNNLIIQGSLFNKAGYGVYVSGLSTYSKYQQGLLIQSNEFKDSYAQAIYLISLDAPTVQYNKIESNSSFPNVAGIKLSSMITKCRVIGNRITLSNGGSGIDLTSLNSSQTQEIANNDIYITGTSVARGIYVYYSDNVEIYHNTIRIKSTSLDKDVAAVKLLGNNNRLFNNNLAVLDEGYVVYFEQGSFSSNYNNLYSKGKYTGFYNEDIKDLQEWKQLTGKDNQSLAVNPNFKNASEGIISNAQLNDIAPQVGGLNIDINRVTRKSLTDIGAYEFNPSGTDASLVAMVQPVPPIASGSQEVTVTLFNNGSEILSSAIIDWTINGSVQSRITWSGSLGAQRSTSVNLGIYEFERQKSYELKAWVSNPNGTADTETSNDTINIKNISPALSGVYTIGGTDADFPNFTKATEALMYNGVSGPVEFRAADGIYNEQIEITKVPGISSVNNVTFTSASGDSTKTTINSKSTSDKNYIVSLKRVNYITFKSITLKALDTYYANVLVMKEGTNYITIQHCVLSGKRYTYSGSQYLISATSPSTGNIFEGNVFQDGSYGLYMDGTSSNPQTNIISGNIFHTQTKSCIYLNYPRNTVVENNIITPLSHENYYYAIYAVNSRNGLRISGNQTIIPGTRSKGIYLNTATGSTTEPILIYNNFISFTQSEENIGIHLSSCDNAGVYHNSVRISGTGTYQYEAFNIQSGRNIQVKNNIFAHFGRGRSINVSGSQTITSDYNDLFSAGETLVMWQNSSYKSLESFQAATGMDTHSLSIDPVFESYTSPRVSQSNLDGAGIPVSIVKTDIEGHTRHAQTPDIGADEFGSGLITNDIGITSVIGPKSGCTLDGNQYLAVKLQNFGVDTLKNITIHYVLNDTLKISEELTGIKLKGGQSYNYTFKTPVLMNDHTLYSFDIFTTLDNDSNRDNDSIMNHVIHHFPATTAYAGKDTTICESAQYSLIASGGNTYTWHIRGSETVYATQKVQPVHLRYKTIFVLKAYNTYGCFNTDTVIVDVIPSPEIPVITAVGSLGGACVRDSVTLTSSIKDNIIWSTGKTSKSIKIGSPGYYSVKHIAPLSSCSSSAQIEIKSPPIPRLSTSATTICPGQEVSLAVINGGHSFLWSTGEITSAIVVSPSKTTTYNVKYKSDDGCEMEGNVTVSVRAGNLIPKITSIKGDSAVCPGSDAVLTVEGSATRFSWSNGMSGSTIKVNPTVKTVYTVTALGSVCSDKTVSSSIVVDVLPGPEKAPIIVATGSSTLSFCETDAITLTSSDYSEHIKWSTGDTTPYITVLSQGIYSLSHVSKHGCVKTSTVKIEDPKVPYIVGKKEICKGESTTLTVENGYHYQWSTGATASSITVNPDTTTEYSVLIENKEGCKYEQKVKVIIYEAPIVTGISSDTTICQGTEITLSVSGKAKEFLWTDGHVGTRVKVKPEETRVYGVKATNGCANQIGNDYLNVKVTVLPLPEQPVILQGNDLTFCPGQTITLESNFSDSIRWSTGATSKSITISDTGTYRLEKFNQYMCTRTASVSTKYPEKAHIVIDGKGYQTICKGDAAQLSLINGADYLWSTGATSASIEVSPLVTTTYSVRGRHEYGCLYSDSIKITVIDPVAPAEVKNLIPLNNKADLSLPLSLSWSPALNASHYDIRIWDASETIPEMPFVQNTNQILYRIENGLVYGKKYNWQITSKNSCAETAGPIQQLELRKLPDLEVKNVLVPASAFSGQEIMLSWEVKNSGAGKTVAKEYWFDKIYLSSDSTFEYGIDSYLTGVANKTSLDSGQSYISSATIRLPEGVSGTHYVFIVSNQNNEIKELNHANNIDRNKRYLLVNLTPPPDLQVQEVSTLSNVFSGQTVDLKYTVINKGEGKTNSSIWKDQIYFSADSVFRSGSALVLATVPHNGQLEGGKYYTNTVAVTLPHGIFGKYFIHVMTDQDDQIFEHAYNNNNFGRSNSITVTLLPPSDLVPTVTSIPATASNRDKIKVTWTVKNQGGSATNTGRWKDEIYITNNVFFDEKKAVLIGSRTNYSTLNLGESYTAEAMVTIPDNITGANYIFVVTDRENEVFEHENKGNNAGRSLSILTIKSPDLIVEKATVLNTTVNSGEMLYFQYLVRNKGAGAVNSISWTDSLFIKESVASDVTEVKSRSVVKVVTNRILNPNDTITLTGSIRIPEGANGTVYLQIHSNAERTIYEVTGGNVNNIFNKPVAVNLSPWADLKVSKITAAKDEAETGSVFPLQIKVTNEGKAATKSASWIDKIYISPSPDLEKKDTLLLTGARADFILQKDSSYEYTIDVPIPFETEEGDYYFYVYTDATNKIYEHTDESNNITMYGPVAVTYGPGPDLKLLNLKAPDSVLTGVSYPVEWNVKNIGRQGAYAEWDDAVYLSKDTIWQPGTDIYLSSYFSKHALDTAATYFGARKVEIPEAISGEYYWIVVADYTHKGKTLTNSGDRIRNNNYSFRPVQIIANTIPDLAITDLQAPEEGISGQPITIQYTVTNQGTGTTRPKKWVDKFYLSTDFTIDKNDKLLGSVDRSDSLVAGTSYSVSKEVNLPLVESGNYIILVKTDQENTQYEADQESNNLAASPIHIEMPLPVDLVISEVKADKDQYTAGDDIKISWTIMNKGINPVNGSQEDQFYLSRNKTWDINDVYLGSSRTYMTLPQNGSYTYTGTFRITNASVGSYYIIARTDARNQIPETDENNNETSSLNPVLMDVRELVLNIAENTMLAHKGSLMYKVVIPDSLQNETLLVELTGADQNNHNELYIRYGDAPTRNIYDAAFSRPFSGNQEAIISEMKPGTYYVMVYGENEFTHTQSIMLKASILHFEIRSVKTDVGGDSGPVTTCIQGAKFNPGCEFYIYGNNRPIKASKVFYVNPTKVYATFDLNGAEHGYYDVVSKDTVSGEEAVKFNGFRVEKSTQELLLTDLDHPRSARAGQIVPIHVHFANGGNIDIPTPRRTIVCTGAKVPLGLSVQDLQYYFTSLNMDFTEPEGPEGVLRPGAISDKTFFVSAWAHIQLKILKK
ncbi:parallel beta-helix repeat-containing protein [Sporocytophaga myxococcoides]|uniref:Parallel beta-helix repeat-containing protein n=1 Tax=Sporocytophaga myxococcoides TaxID=153721 RepID=A0A098LGE4_9BACT|nr:CARDB domain-containing protein [Sporocytophaga myxococcoides]GAL86035.1 parallel beta-helix repeat-containing protein [Sporocytophaga myxococcoides]